MPTFRIQIVNKDFSDCDETDFPSADAARKQALKGALQIGMEEVCDGSPFFGAEVSIASDGKVVERMMIAIGASTLR